MNTPPIRTMTDEEVEAGIAANRFMHLLHHPEEQDRDGEQTDETRNRAMNNLTGTSTHVPIIAPQEQELAITVKFVRTNAPTPMAKTKDIAPWMNTSAQIHKA